MTCHMARSRPCHVAYMQDIGHATCAKPRPCRVAHRLGLSLPTWHLSTIEDMPHGTYARPKPCHVAHMLGLSHAMCYLLHAIWYLG
jgi:hypothetical protein